MATISCTASHSLESGRPYLTVELTGGCPNKTGRYGADVPSFPSEPRRITVHAVTDLVTVLVVPAEAFLSLINSSYLTFSHGLAMTLRYKQQIFNPLEAFVAAIAYGMSNQIFHFHSLKKLYMSMVPALHAMMHSDRLDVGAWTYAIQRLPRNIPTVSVIVMSRKILDVMEALPPEAQIPDIESP
jgi:hypothetical protein